MITGRGERGSRHRPLCALPMGSRGADDDAVGAGVAMPLPLRCGGGGGRPHGLLLMLLRGMDCDEKEDASRAVKWSLVGALAEVRGRSRDASRQTRGPGGSEQGACVRVTGRACGGAAFEMAFERWQERMRNRGLAPADACRHGRWSAHPSVREVPRAIARERRER